jgi:hypothetical protein
MTTMRPRDLFGVGVRILAVWFWTMAAYYGFWAFIKSVGTAPIGNISIREDISWMIYYVLVGVFLMSGARGLTWLGYGDVSKSETAAESAQSEAESAN